MRARVASRAPSWRGWRHEQGGARMLTLAAFVLAIGVLITVHEYGHYRVARAVGVKVLRFSIGFGRPLLRWRRGETEFVLAALPLGGYVRMVDEREAPVAAADRPHAFNRQSLPRRAAVVAAGPLANLLLAALLFALVAAVGEREPLPILAAPTPGSVAAMGGVRGGDVVLAVDGHAVSNWPDAQLRLLEAIGDGPARLAVRRADGTQLQLQLPLAGVRARADALAAAGVQLQGPPARIDAVQPDSAAQAAGLSPGDVVLAVGNDAVGDAAALLRMIQHSGGAELSLRVRRGSTELNVALRPRAVAPKPGAAPVWRIGALLGGAVPTTLVRHAPLAALGEGFTRTWELSALTVRTLGRMVLGHASLDMLSGPLTIADYAGRSAELGWLAYLSFLAVVSVSLGVLNLLPIPVLDGGHLLYYAWEAVTRRALPQRVQDVLQQGGVALIAVLMAIALYNDLARLLGPIH
jgi:regulator of sigma E protease